jgi:hypothetical protein
MNSDPALAEAIAQAHFWKQKYLEQMMNHAQVVAALMRPSVLENAVNAMGVPPEPEKPSTEQPAGRNGASKESAATP